MKISWSERSTIAKVPAPYEGLSIVNSIKIDKYDAYVHFFASAVNIVNEVISNS